MTGDLNILRCHPSLLVLRVPLFRASEPSTGRFRLAQDKTSGSGRSITPLSTGERGASPTPVNHVDAHACPTCPAQRPRACPFGGRELGMWGPLRLEIARDTWAEHVGSSF